MFDIISIGDCGQDIFLELDHDSAHLHSIRCERRQICLNYASKQPVIAKHDCVGGNAANVATAFSRLDLNTAICTHLGDDNVGDRIIREFKHNHLALDYVQIEKNEESNYNTVLNFNGERTILVYHVHRKYYLPKMKAAKWLYFTSMGESFERIVPDILKYVQEHRVKLVYQPGTYQLRAGKEHLKSLLKNTEVISMNKEEAEHFLELKDAEPVPALLSKMLKLGIKTALITDAGNGAYVSNGLEAYHLAVPGGIERVDTTGAGDSFSAGFVAAQIHGLGLAESLRWGQAEAGSVIQFYGAQTGLLYRKQLEHYLKDNPGMQPKKIDL